MNEVLTRIREKYPQYDSVNDDELIRKIGEKYPAYLENKSFGDDFHRITAPRLTDEDATSIMLRERMQAAPNLPFSPEAGTGLTLALNEAGANALGYVGNVARAIPADVAAGFSLLKRPEGAVDERMKYAAEASGNIPAAIMGKPLPIDATIAEAAKESKGAAIAAHLSQDLAATAPLLAIGGLPAAAQRAAIVGFTAKMATDVPEIATELGAELGKPKDQQDPDKVAKLISSAVQVTGFVPLGGVAINRMLTPKPPSAAPTVETGQREIANQAVVKTFNENVRLGNTETAKALAEGEKGSNAVQESSPAQSVLRQERPEVGLPEMGAGGVQGQAIAPEAKPLNPGGAVKDLPPELQAIEAANAAKQKQIAEEFKRSLQGKDVTQTVTFLDRLESLKFKDAGGLSGELYTLRPDILSKVGKQLWNDAIDVAIAGIKAGKAVGLAINDAISHIRSKHPDVDEAGLRDGFSSIFSPEKTEIPDTTGESVKMRKSAERATTSEMIPEPVQERIKTAPESFYQQQSMKRVEDAVAEMSELDLAGVSPDSNLYVAARLEQAKRLFEAGKNDEGYQVFAELEAKGTQFGQLVNQFKQLKGSRPESVVVAINKTLEKAGRDPLKPEAETKVIEIAKDSKAKDSELKKSTDEWTKNPTPENAAKAESALDAANESALELQRFVGKYQPRSTPAILKSILQGNLLTPISQVANLIGNAVNLPFRSGTRTIASGLDIVDAALRGKPREISVGPVSGTAESIKGAGRGLAEIPKILKRGSGESIKGETRAGLHPLRAWVNQFAKNPEAPTKGGKLTLTDRINLAIEGTLGVPAEAMLRGLGAGDAPFRQAAHARVIAEQLRLQKVPKDQWGMAQKFPELFFDRATMDRIRTETMAAIFQRDSATLKHITNWIRGKGDWFDLAVATVAPYKLTPWNIIAETLSYNPLVAIAKTLAAVKKGNSREAKMSAAKFIVGSTVTTAAWWLYKNGLLAPSMDEKDEAQKARLLAGEVLPPNHVNVSGLKRALSGGDPAFKPGDETVNIFRSGGLAGSIMYMTANIGRDFERNPSPENEEVFKQILTQSTLEQARFGLNQSFLSGVEGLLTAVKDGNADSYIQQYGNTVSSIPLPNTLSAITRATRDYKVDVKDDKVMNRLENVIKNKLGVFGAADDLPLKRDLWGRPQRETPKGSNPLVYQLLDVTKNQEITDDPVSLEIYRLWRKTGSSEMIPSLPGRTITQGGVTYALNPEQRSRLAELVGARRREISEGLVVDPNYHALNDEQKVALLKRAYDFGQRQGGGQFLLENQGKLAVKPKAAGF